MMPTIKEKLPIEKIRMEYITTRVTYTTLCKKYGLSLRQLGKIASRERWVEKRKAYQDRCIDKAVKKAATAESNRLAKLMDATNRAADAALKALEDPQQLNRYIVSDGIGGGATETSEKIFEKVDTKALRDLTTVIKDLTVLMREFYNLPTPQQAESQRIAAERLAMDQKKADLDAGSDVQRIEIVGLPEGMDV